MRLGLVVRRLNQLPHVEPIARAAHARGHAVTLFLDQRGPKEGPKAAQWPDPAKIPPRWQPFATLAAWSTDPHRLLWIPGAQSWWWDSRERGVMPDPDALVVAGPIAYTDGLGLPPGVLCAALQTSWSDMAWLSGAWDVAYAWSPWWRAAMDQYQRATGRTAALSRTGNPLDRVPVVPVGFPPADHLAWIDRDAVRRRFGLPATRPVYVLAPFPFRAHDRQGWRLRWLYRYSPVGDALTLATLRRAVDEQGGVLVVKSRPKTSLPRSTRRAADLVVEDAEAGEPTMLELLSVAAGAVGFYSTTVLESVAAGCPWLCLAPPVWPAYGDRLGRAWWEPLHSAPPMVTKLPLTWLGVPPLASVGWPPSADICAARRERYVRDYLGGEPFRAGERVVEDLEARVSLPRVAALPRMAG